MKVARRKHGKSLPYAYMVCRDDDDGDRGHESFVICVVCLQQKLEKIVFTKDLKALYHHTHARPPTHTHAGSTEGYINRKGK